MDWIFKGTIFLIVLGCNKNNCPIGTNNNQMIFKKNLDLIASYENGKKPVLVEEYRSAINYLSFVSGISSKADYSSTFGYQKREDFKNDMALWKKWYKKNKCLLTEKYVDSIFKKYNYTYPQ